MATIANLFVELNLRADNFNNQIRAAQKESRELEKTFKPMTQALNSVGQSMIGVGAAISAIGVPFAALAVKALNNADNLRDMAMRTGSTVEALSALKFEADKSGTSISAVETAMKKMNVTIENAATGNKTAAESLAKIGLTTQELLAAKPDERFFMIAEGLARIQDPALRAGLAVEILGRSGTDIIPMLEGMAGGQNAVMNSARAMGVVLSSDAANAADAFNDSITNLVGSFTGLFNAVVSSGLLAQLTGFINMMASGIASFSQAHPLLTSIALALGGISAVLGPLLLGFGFLLTSISGLIGPVTSLIGLLGIGGGLTAVVGTLAAAIGVAGLGAAIGFAIGQFINWTLQVTGLQTQFDIFVRRIVNAIPIIGQWATGQKMVTEAAAGTTKAQQQLIAEFAKHGVTVDAARLSDSKYLASLAELSKEWTKNTAATKANTNVVQQQVKHYDALAASTNAARKNVADITAILGQRVEPIQAPIPTELPVHAPIGNVPMQPSGLPVQIPGMPDSVTRAQEEQRIASERQWEAWRVSGQRAIDQVVNDMSRMFIDGITHGKHLWESFKNMGKNAVAGVLDTMISKMAHAVLDPFATILGKFIDTLTGKLTGFLTDFATSAAKSAASGAIGTAAQAGTQAATSGASAGSQAAGAASSIASGGLIQAAVSAAGSIGVIFQLKRIEGTMNAVEYNTRASMIHLSVMIDNFFHHWNMIFDWLLQHAGWHTNQLDAIFNLLAAGGSPGTAASGAAVAVAGPAPVAAAGGGVSIVINLNVSGTSNAQSFAKDIAEALDEVISTGKWGYREAWTLAFSQNLGVVSTVPAG